MQMKPTQRPSAHIKPREDSDHHQVGNLTLKCARWNQTTEKLITPSFDIIYSLRIVQFTNVLSFDSIDSVQIDETHQMFVLF